MKRIGLALLLTAAIGLYPVAYARKAPTSGAQIYGIRYGGGTVPFADGDLWMGISVDSDSTSFYVPDTRHHHSDKPNLVVNHIKKHMDKAQIFVVPSSSIKSITLSQAKQHRIGTGIAVSVISLGAGIPVMFTKSTKDYIELTWDDGGKKGAAEFQADKKDYRALLTALSGASGVPVTAAVDTDAKK